MTAPGPDLKEHRIRLAISLGGLALLALALVLRWGQWGPATVEAIALGGVFFGGSAIWSWRVLRKGP